MMCYNCWKYVKQTLVRFTKVWVESWKVERSKWNKWPPCWAPFFWKEYMGRIIAATMAGFSICASLLFGALGLGRCVVPSLFFTPIGCNDIRDSPSQWQPRDISSTKIIALAFTLLFHRSARNGIEHKNYRKKLANFSVSYFYIANLLSWKSNGLLNDFFLFGYRHIVEGAVLEIFSWRRVLIKITSRASEPCFTLVRNEILIKTYCYLASLGLDGSLCKFMTDAWNPMGFLAF